MTLTQAARCLNLELDETQDSVLLTPETGGPNASTGRSRETKDVGLKRSPVGWASSVCREETQLDLGVSAQKATLKSCCFVRDQLPW